MRACLRACVCVCVLEIVSGCVVIFGPCLIVWVGLLCMLGLSKTTCLQNVFVTLYVHLSAEMYRVFGKGRCWGHLM